MKEKIIKAILIIVGILMVIFLTLEIFGLRLNYTFFIYKEPNIPDECRKLPSVVSGGYWLKEVASGCPNCYIGLNDTYTCHREERSSLFYRIK